MSDEKERKEDQGRRGSWVWEMYQYTPHCSLCGGDGLRGPANGPRFDFCPHCGADMREKREDQGPGGLQIVEVDECGLDVGGEDQELGGVQYYCRACRRIVTTYRYKHTSGRKVLMECPACGELTVLPKKKGDNHGD